MATLVVKTKMDNTELTRQYNKIKRDLSTTLKEQESLNNSIKGHKQDLEEASQKYDSLIDKISQYNQKLKELDSKKRIGSDGNVYKDVEDVAESEKIKKELENTQIEAAKVEKTMYSIEQKIESQSLKEEKVNNKVKNLNDSLDKTNQKMEAIDNTENKADFSKLSKGLSNSIKKIGKMAVALFGLRSIYSALQNSANSLANYNDDFKSKLESIKTTMSLALAPIIQKIVDWVYKLVQYAQYLIYAFTGYDIFKGAKDNLSSANKSAKELKKTLASFDTANVLSDNSDSSSSSSVEAMKALSDSEVPSILKTIAEHADTAKLALLGLFAGATLIKIMSGISTLMGSGAAFTGLAGLGSMLLILAAGVLIPIAAKGVVEVYNQFQGLKEQVKALNEVEEKNSSLVDKLRDQYENLKNSGELTEAQVKRYKEALDGQIDSSKRALESGKLNVTQKETEIETIKKTTSFYKDLYDQGLLNEQQTTDYKNSLQKAIEALEGNGQSAKDLRKAYKDLTGEEYSTKCTIKTDVDTTPAEKKMSSFSDKLNKIWTLFTSPSKWSNWGAEWKKIWNGTSKLAVGGIVNNPGHGVPVGGAIAGEAGREAVLPLTDANTMALLGQEIGKWISVNVDLTTKLDSRVLNKSLQQVQNKNSFTRNGG